MAENSNGGPESIRDVGESPAESINAVEATDIMSVEPRLLPQERQSRWGGCFCGLTCFGSQKRGKRIVPASQIPDVNASSSHINGHQSAGFSNENTTLNLSILAPPSSPASFTNSRLPSTAQSPNCFLSMSANSPGGPSLTMFATGPYAHETQLVSPPAFSTFTTEPSTAPLTPPPELAHLTTPSSPDVPFARFLLSSLDIRSAVKGNGVPYLSSNYAVGSYVPADYPIYPGSPSSSLISPASGTPRTGLSSPFPESGTPRQWDASASAQDSPCFRNGVSKLFGHNSATTRDFILCPDSSFFYPATSAQFHLDQALQTVAHTGGRLSVSKEADAYSSGGNRHNKACKQDVEEIEAYRASFGFSADEIITTQHYVEVSDTLEESFTMSLLSNSQTGNKHCPTNGCNEYDKKVSNSLDPISSKQLTAPLEGGVDCESDHGRMQAGPKLNKHSQDTSPLVYENTDTDGGEGRKCRAPADHQLYKRAQSFSDAEVDYRRARSLRETNAILAWHDMLN
ncbi:uncharacterized protein At1g76660-like isoform X1 [Zingiber officinale]|uniref:uncharacterized protein At1g76660-like isoform X1 n=1 Tax=Zingiber officinale TaxID=94328 RepID=UPI001C4B9569|nr:uncharacterized protein At1g76660-like isoform X1 [Zingiber officinale]XP_042418619.1 uncharacterized protein At1g76660-like isoform X1 [Zingiber officinale]